MTPSAGACLSRLTLTNFRCYEALRLETDAQAIVLTGPNGAGKTNVLEAISLLTPGRGLRNAKTIEIGRKSIDVQPRRWGAAAVVSGPGGESTLGVGCDPETHGERRKVQVDGAPARGQAALAERFSALWLTPQMDQLFIDGAEERRRYLDRLAATFDPAHIGRVSNYRNAMRQRLSLLKEGRADPTWLDALEAEMAARAVAVAAARNETALLLDTAAAEGVGAFPRASVIVDGTAERLLETGPALAAEDVLREKLAADRGRDAQLGATATGPHRSDMVVADRARGLKLLMGLPVSKRRCWSHSPSHPRACWRPRRVQHLYYCWMKSLRILTPRAAQPCLMRRWHLAGKSGSQVRTKTNCARSKAAPTGAT